jgi:hypothetical protein
VLAVACSPPRSVVTARALVEDPSGHDAEEIVLVGTVENPRREVASRGPGYTSFTLADGTARVPVIAWGTQEVGMGDVVEVRGAFRTRLGVGDQMVPDAVEAKFVRVVRRAGQPPGTPVSPP